MQRVKMSVAVEVDDDLSADEVAALIAGLPGIDVVRVEVIDVEPGDEE